MAAVLARDREQAAAEKMVRGKTSDPADAKCQQQGAGEDHGAAIVQPTCSQVQRLVTSVDLDRGIPEQCVSDGDPIRVIERGGSEARVCITLPV